MLLDIFVLTFLFDWFGYVGVSLAKAPRDVTTF